MSRPTIILPGQPLGSLSKALPGSGTHAASSEVYASLAGPRQTSKTSKTISTVSIRRPPPTSTTTPSAILPSVDNVVLARVTRLQQRQAVVEILVIYPATISTSASTNTPSDNDDEGVLAPPGFQGIIRSQDVRATEKDRVKIAESFAVGDIVRGVVVSLGDQSAYYISTARNELGVLMAVSKAGNQMVPVSWREFVDQVTGTRELRKVAKPF